MAVIAGLPAEEVRVCIGSESLPLLRARDLAAAVDPAALLGADDVPEPPYWMHLWPGAVALARRVRAARAFHGATRVLEIGCGLALPSLCAARRGMRVVASDWQPAPLAFARASAARNGVQMAVVQMDWDAPCLRSSFDLCLGADVAYDERAEVPLVALLGKVLAPGGRAWLADSVNTVRRTLVPRLEAAGFRVSANECQETDEGHPVWVRLLEVERS